MRGVETECGRLGDVTEAGRPVLRGLEVILQILRLGGHFCGDIMAPLHPLPHRGCTAEIYGVYTMVVHNYFAIAPTTEEI